MWFHQQQKDKPPWPATTSPPKKNSPIPHPYETWVFTKKELHNCKSCIFSGALAVKKNLYVRVVVHAWLWKARAGLSSFWVSGTIVVDYPSFIRKLSWSRPLKVTQRKGSHLPNLNFCLSRQFSHGLRPNFWRGQAWLLPKISSCARKVLSTQQTWRAKRPSRLHGWFPHRPPEKMDAFEMFGRLFLSGRKMKKAYSQCLQDCEFSGSIYHTNLCVYILKRSMYGVIVYLRLPPEVPKSS